VGPLLPLRSNILIFRVKHVHFFLCKYSTLSYFSFFNLPFRQMLSDFHFDSISQTLVQTMTESVSKWLKTSHRGSKVHRQTATTHGGGLGESFEVGNSCPETHRYAPVGTFLERMNARLAISHGSGQRARSGMRLILVLWASTFTLIIKDEPVFLMDLSFKTAKPPRTLKTTGPVWKGQ